MAACFGTAKPRAGGGASAQQPIVPSENPSGSARLKSSSNSVSNTATAFSKFAVSSASCSNSAAATASSCNLASSLNLQSAFVSKEEVKLWNF